MALRVAASRSHALARATGRNAAGCGDLGASSEPGSGSGWAGRGVESAAVSLSGVRLPLLHHHLPTSLPHAMSFPRPYSGFSAQLHLLVLEAPGVLRVSFNRKPVNSWIAECVMARGAMSA